jgi:3-hydroxyisobutyrate dehydrogenase-like beta-hydroxyacid dehydrogenase
MDTSTVIGLLHPGEMGAEVGRCLAERGHLVLWASLGRSEQTARRAAGAGLTDAGTAADLADRAEVIISVCPPHCALDVARSVRGFGGLYVDANAISPATARRVAEVVTGGGARYVDGGIIGPPPVEPGSTRLHLSGHDSEVAARLFDGTPLDARSIPGSPWAASAVKMAYAAWTKGSAALLLAIRALAEREGVAEVLLAEWNLSQPGIEVRSGQAARSAASKGWRWVAEMEEIAATMAEVGLPEGFHLAAAEIYRHASKPAAVQENAPGERV